MAGIEDLMNIRTQGGTQNAPPMPPMGGGQPPMPPMGGGQPPMPPMGEMAATERPPMSSPMPEPGMGEMAAMEAPPMEAPGMNLEQDSMLLAEAVVGRAQGDIGAAIAVLDNAKAMLIASVENAAGGMAGGVESAMDQNPQRMNGGGALKPIPAGNKGLPKLPKDVRNNMGFMNMGGPLYAADGMSMGDTDILRQMIMENLQKPAVQEQAMKNVVGQMGRGVSDKDQAMADLMKFKMA